MNSKAILKDMKGNMASVLLHIETGNIKFLNDIVWSIEVGDNLGDRLDTKRKAK